MNWAGVTATDDGHYTLPVIPGERTRIFYDREMRGLGPGMHPSGAPGEPKMWKQELLAEVAPQNSEPIELGKTRVPPAVVGKVVDEDGQPVAGVQVKLYLAGADPKSPAAFDYSDITGEFRFLIELGKQGEIIADDTKHNRQGYAYCILPPQPADYQPRITLKPIREITLKVVDRSGAPLSAHGDRAGELRRQVKRRFGDLTTDADGVAKLRFTDDAGIRQFIAFKPDTGFDVVWPTQPTRPGEPDRPLPPELTLRLRGARTVRIKAINKAGQPLAGVRFGVWSIVTALERGRRTNTWLQNCPTTEATTDAAGIAEFAWIPVNLEEVRFQLASPDFTVVEKENDPTAKSLTHDPLWLLPNRRDNSGGELTVQLEQRRMTKLSGHVYDVAGKPAAEVRVWAMVRSLGRGVGGGATSSHADGAYEMLVDSEKAYTLTLFDERFPAANLYGVVVRDGKPVSDLDFHLTEGTIVRGAVTSGADHRPVTDQEITIGLDLGPIPWEILHAQIDAGMQTEREAPARDELISFVRPRLMQKVNFNSASDPALTSCRFVPAVKSSPARRN